MGHGRALCRRLGGVHDGGNAGARRRSDVRAPTSEPGVSYTNDRVAAVPWSIHVLKIDRSRRI